MTAGIRIDIGAAGHAPADHQCIVDVAVDTFGVLGLQSAPDVRLAPDAESGAVTINGDAALISATRSLLIDQRFGGFGDAPRVRSVDHAGDLVRARLQANLGRLVELDCARVASETADRQRAAALIEVARLGVAPATIATVADGISFDHPDPSIVADQLIAAAAAHLAPVVELSASKAHRISGCTIPPIATGLPYRVSSRRTPRNDLRVDVGVDLPHVTTRFVDLPDDVVRIRVGAVTWAHRVIPANSVAVNHPMGAVDTPNAIPAIDPLHGEPWSVIDPLALDAIRTPTTRVYSQQAYLARLIHFESFRLAGLFVVEDRRPYWMLSPPLDDQAQVVWRAVRRYVAAAGGSAAMYAAILEGILRSLAVGRTTVADMVEQSRLTLGAGVLGPVPTSVDFDIHRVDRSTADAALRDRAANRLLPPDRQTSSLTQIVVCPDDRFAAVAELVRPLFPSMLLAREAEVDEDTFARLRAMSRV